MSHQYTHAEIDNAKIQVLQFKLGMNAVPFEKLYEQAIALLDGSLDSHVANEDKPPETEQLDG